MRYKTILITALSMMLFFALTGTPAVASPDAPDSDSEYQAPSPPPPPDAGDQPDVPSWQCPKCGTDCPAPHARRARGMRAPRQGHGHSEGIGHHGFGRRGGGRGTGLPSDRMLHGAARLELTDEQIEQLEKLAYDAKSKLIDLESDLEKAQLEMRRQMETDSDDLAAMKKQLDSLSKKRVSIQELKLENWIDAKKVLNEDQKKMIRDKFPRMGMRL